jgi:probable F420-dependent oxidoreductase
VSAPTLTVSLPTFGDPPGGDWRAVLDLARAAEDAGVDRVVVSDHVVMGRHTDRYVWGRFPLPPEGPWAEPLTMLTAMAVVTSTVRLATGILIAPLRPAALLAKTVATLDQLSEGRVDLGVGTGWQREEYDAEGIDFEKRGRLLTDTVAACRALWSDTPASFSSPSISFDDIFCEPKPVQSPQPVGFSGVLHERHLRRVVDLGDGWIPIMGASVDDLRDGASRLRAAFVEAGRDPSSLRVQGSATYVRGDDGRPDLARTLDGVPALVDAGATDVAINLRVFCPDLADAPRVLKAMATGFAAAVGR